MERFRFHVEEINRNVTIFTLTPEECRSFIARYTQLRAEEPELNFQTYILDGLVEKFEDKILPLLSASVDDDSERLASVLDSLFSICLTMNPMLNFMALEMVLPDLDGWGDIIPESYPSPEEERAKFSPEENRAKVRGMYEHLCEVIVDQEGPCQTISNSFKRSAIGINDPNKPVCSFILAGCSGVGKTLMVKEINKYMYPDQSLVRIDCSEFQQEHEYAKLIGCFIPGSLVSLEGGEQRPIEDIQVGDTVITHTGTGRTVQEVYEYENKGELIFFRAFGDPRACVCTPQHEIMIWEESLNCGVWTKAKDLKEGDWLLFPHNEFTHSRMEEDPGLWELMGWYLARGKLYPSLGKTCFSFWNKELDARRRVLNLITEYFDTEDVSLQLAEDNSTILSLKSTSLAAFFNMSTRSDGTRWIPPWVMEDISRKEAISLLAGLFCLASEDMNAKDAYFSTFTVDLFSQVRLLGARAGYLPVGSMLETEDGTYLYRLTLPFPHLWNIVREHRGDSPHQAKDPIGQMIVPQGTLTQITRVNSAIYNGAVYDLSVEGEDTSYLVNQIAVHNSPPGYKDSDREGYLTSRIKRNPHSIVLIDEIEKADLRLFDLFLQILDEGLLTDNKGNTVDCTKAAFFFTTNLGNDYVQQHRVGFSTEEGEFGSDHEEYRQYVLGEINEFFRLEMIARVNEIIVFHRLSQEGYLRIVDLETSKLLKRLRQCGDFHIRLTPTAREAIVYWGASQEFGARGIADVLRNELEDKIADYLLEQEVKGGLFRLGWSNRNGFKLDLLDLKRARKEGGKSAKRHE